MLLGAFAGALVFIVTTTELGNLRKAGLFIAAFVAGALAAPLVAAMLGVLPSPDPAAVLLATVVLTALIGSRGSVMRLLPHRRQPTPNARNVNRRYLP
ncbi:putative holin [Aeromonas eucrenophila]|uniref:Holin n=1 Tax=Aeromonas eucrenophila TaxID=649 RepID=A0ABW0YB76_9GAMM|nr:putative holin [Aeromonas eucrenophila]